VQLSSDAFTYMVYTGVLVGVIYFELKGALSAGKTVNHRQRWSCPGTPASEARELLVLVKKLATLSSPLQRCLLGPPSSLVLQT
jgi:hypothetical protein